MAWRHVAHAGAQGDRRSDPASTSMTPKESDAPEFRVGQVWRYRTRPHEPGSTLTVTRLTDDPVVGRLVHVRIDGLVLSIPSGGPADSLPHAVLTEAALGESVTELVGQAEALPDDRDWYEAWRSGHEEGESQVSEEPVAELLDTLEDMLSA